MLDEEINHVVFDITPLKAPRPDNLHATFYQCMWNVVGESMRKFVKNFFGSRLMPKGMNDTDITLIPKVDHPEQVNHFKPISICNVSYKVITKLMTNRLKHLMKHVISPQHSNFVSGRQITDNVIIYQKTLNAMR